MGEIKSDNIRFVITSDTPDKFNLMYNFTTKLFENFKSRDVITIEPSLVTKTYIKLNIDSNLDTVDLPNIGNIDCVRVEDNGKSVLFHSKLNEPMLGIEECQIVFKLKSLYDDVTKPNRRFNIG